MSRFALAVSLAAGIVAACGDMSAPGDPHRWVDSIDETEPTPGFGWEHAITSNNFDPMVAARSGNASATIEGNTLRAIVSDPDVRVRADDQACASCHDWAADIDRASFCQRVLPFLSQPTSTGGGGDGGADPTNAKPLVLKYLLATWAAEGCPD